MKQLIALHKSMGNRLDHLDWLIPTLARACFGGVLFYYFWQSGVSKIAFGQGALGIFQVTDSALIQIFPKSFETAGYDSSQIGLLPKMIAWAGGWAEIALPLLILLGLMTRLCALGMIGFVAVQSLTDIYAHGVAIGVAANDAWFDRYSDGLIMDQRAFWVLLLATLFIKGAGPLSLDRILKM